MKNPCCLLVIILSVLCTGSSAFLTASLQKTTIPRSSYMTAFMEMKKAETAPTVDKRPFDEKEPETITDMLPYLPKVSELQVKKDQDYMRMALDKAVSE